MAALFADETLFLGKDLLPWLLFAFGSAMVVGNLMAMFRPPPDSGKGGSASRSGGQSSKQTAPAAEPNRNRMIVMIVIGAVVAIWSGVSLFT